jgi:phage replication-related protein YjqB (UPF0714/DUF867 family)
MLDALLAEPGVEERCELRSPFGFLALHGGLEQNTAEIAEAAADRAGASLYAVVQPEALRWHVPSHQYELSHSDVLAGFLEHVDVVVSVHGYGGLRTSDDRWTTALVGGANRDLARTVACGLRGALPEYTWLDDFERFPANLRGVHPRNPVNMATGGGVQLELPPRVRGFGHFWRDFTGPGLPPHTETLITTLAGVAVTGRATGR